MEEELFEVVKGALPHREVARKPRGGGRKRRRIRTQGVDAALAGALEQAGALEGLEVLGDDVEREVEGGGEIGDAVGPILQELEYPAPGRMTQRQEDIVELRLAVLTFTHMDE